MRRPVLPSGWSCLSLVQHLAVDDERFWFQGVVAGEQAVKDEVAAGSGCAWQVGPDVLTETATHAGHLDAARELIDGRTWLVVD